jgi:hypothetical protein
MQTHLYRLATGQFLSDLDLTDTLTHIGTGRIVHLAADTGVGKSTFVVEQLARRHRVIFVVPQRMQIQQLMARYGQDPRIQFIFGGHDSGTPHRSCIVCTYDQLAHVAEHVELSRYWLVVDEVHKLYQAASYRGPAITNVLECILEQRCQQVLTLSATLTPALLPFRVDHWIDVVRPHPVPRQLEVRLYPAGPRMQEAILSLRPSAGRCLVIRVNDKAQQAHFKKGFEMVGLDCLAINRDRQADEEIQQLLTSERIDARHDVVLTTSLTDEAINITNQNIEAVHIFRDRIHAEELRQFVGRFRQQNPPMVYHLSEQALAATEIDLTQRRRHLESLGQALLGVYRHLDGLGIPADANRLNTVLENLGAPIKLLTTHVTDAGWPEPVLDPTAILADLYRCDTHNHYASAQTLEARLKQQFDSIEVRFCKESDGVSPQFKAQQDRIRDAVLFDHTQLMQSCWDEAVAACPEDETLDAGVACCAERHPESTLRGKVFSDWDMLNRVVLIDPGDSFDALLQQQAHAVWRFWKAANEDLLIQPLLARLHALPCGTVLNGDQAVQLFLESYRDTCREHPPFKEILRRAGGNRITVKANNHLAVSRRFVFRVLRHFSHCLERRSNGVYYFEFRGIQPFGYRYRLGGLNRTLKTLGLPSINTSGESRAIRSRHSES